MTRRPILASIPLLALAGLAQADVRLPAILGSGMVIQQQTDAAIWGWADPGEKIEVSASWLDKPVNVTAAADGTWSCSVHTPAGSMETRTVTIKGHNTIALQNVLIGEVWVCGGQSNMEWGLAGTDGGKAAVEGSNNPGLRLFNVKKTVSAKPESDCTADGLGGVPGWSECTPKSTPGFSAVAYFFGREVHEQIKVPIGLLGSYWGGTPAESWASEETIAMFPEFSGQLKAVAEARNAPPQDTAPEPASPAWWARLEKLDPGSAGGAKPAWAQPGFDDSKWGMMGLPCTWSGDLANYDGIIWNRRTVEVPAGVAGKDLTLSLGPIDDADTTYFDGVKVGGGDQWDVPRIYTVPAALATPGKHVIAICAVDFQGIGGVNGKPEQMWLGAKASPTAADHIALDGYWRFEKGADIAKLNAGTKRPQLGPNTPTVLYNGMIEPIRHFAIRGAIWYQGESNRGRADQYAKLFPAMITDWRKQFGRAEAPFYFVQIAPFTYGDKGQTAEIREAQAAALALPNTGMAVTMDIGNPKDIHPRNKEDVGHRLAVWALAKTYGTTALEHAGPMYQSIKIEGDKARVTFTHAAGLFAGGPTITGFEIAGADGQFAAATARVDGDAVVLSAPAVKAPTQARYAWCDGCDDLTPLFNSAKLPMAPFRTAKPAAK